MAFVVVYDANVLYPVELRDFLIRLALAGIYQAKWTHQILDETFDAIVTNRPELADRLQRTRQQMNNAIEDVIVTGYESLIPALDLPDQNDRHVLAAAIRSHAQVIVTNNLRDFPQDKLDIYDIEAQSPDDFTLHVFNRQPTEVVAVLERQASDLTNPPVSVENLLNRLEARGLNQLAQAVRSRRRSGA